MRVDRYNSKKITMIPFTEVERDYKILLGKFVDQTRFPHTGGLYKRQETRIQLNSYGPPCTGKKGRRCLLGMGETTI
jgi:hypothetical protein